MYGHLRCVYTVLANPTHAVCARLFVVHSVVVLCLSPLCTERCGASPLCTERCCASHLIVPRGGVVHSVEELCFTPLCTNKRKCKRRIADKSTYEFSVKHLNSGS